MAAHIVRLKDLDGSFWEQNKELALMTPFSDFKKKAKSDKIMKAIYLIWDSKSTFRKSGMSPEQILEDINTNFLGNPNFDWEPYQKYVEAYKELCMSRLYKKVLAMLDEIEEIDEARLSISWSDDVEYKQKIELFDASKKLYAEAITLQKELDEEVEAIELESEYVLSMNEELAI
jgi:type I site-specific restriction endonuclease